MGSARRTSLKQNTLKRKKESHLYNGHWLTNKVNKAKSFQLHVGLPIISIT